MSRDLVLAQLVADAVRLEIAPLRAEFENLRDQLANQGRAIKTIADICREYGYSRATVERNPWLMPNWGKSDFTGTRKRWKRETYAAWFSMPVDARHRQWLNMPLKDKKKIQGEP